MVNNVVLVGRLTRDPEIRQIASTGTTVASFTLAIDRDYKNKDGSVTTDFIPVEIMGRPAEFCASYVKKGRLVAVQGSIRVEKYETQTGETKIYTKVSGRNIQALDRGTQTNVVPDMWAEANPFNEAPKFEPKNVVSPTDFAAVDDDDVPF